MEKVRERLSFYGIYSLFDKLEDAEDEITLEEESQEPPENEVPTYESNNY